MRELELIYEGVNPRKVGELEAFRDRAELRSEVYGGLVYKSWSLNGTARSEEESGREDEAVVFLPGGMAHGEVWFPQMLDIRSAHRSIAFSLPECTKLDRAAEGVLFSLEQMGVRRAVIVGYSMGGLVAQCMVRQNPQMMAGAVFALTGAPVPGLPQEVRTRWADRRKRKFRTQLLNLTNTTRMAMAENVFQSNCPEDMEREMDFWRAFIEDSYCNHLYLKQYVNLNYAAQPDLYKAAPFSPEDTAGWEGKITILHSENDALYAKEQPFLFDLYPQAKRVDIGKEGQFAMLAHREEVSREIAELADACLGVK